MLYNKSEAARLMRASEKTVNRAIDEGRLKACVIGSVTRIAQEELERFIGSRIVAKKDKDEEMSGVIPRGILRALETEMQEIRHGTVSLTIHLRDYKPRFVIGREQSFMDGEDEA